MPDRLPGSWTIALLAMLALRSPMTSADERVDFNRDVRPILSDRCFQCHGPDANQRQGELRLDLQEAAFAPRKTAATIVPGKPDESELWRRIIASDLEERMPPKEGGRPLTAEQIAILKRWIEQGAKWQTHWAFLPPERPRIPEVNAKADIRSPMDALILARLAKERVTPTDEADKSTLLRRVTLDLTGLPSTPEEVAAFLKREEPDAYERAVDRLLASPRYGERMAIRWLDAARYADTSGYQSDGERHMWRWRDWVIEAFNANMPFDQFTIEQLAGDLLPNPTLEQRIATGFNRNHRANSEGGIIPEEYAVEYVVDRVETTCTVWLGLTMGCVRCHDHKFDPFTQRDFYGLYAFFNNIPEKGRANKLGNSPPFIKAPTQQQRDEHRTLALKMSRAQLAWQEQGEPRLFDELEQWRRTATPPNRDWLPEENLVVAVSFDVPGELGAEARLSYAPGKRGRALDVAGKNVAIVGDVAKFEFVDQFTLSAWIRVLDGQAGTIISRMTDVPQGDGYQLAVVDGKLQLNLVKRWLDDALRIETTDRIIRSEQGPARWMHVAATYDGSRTPSGVRLYVDGQEQTKVVLLDELNQTFSVKEPLRIGSGGGPAGNFGGAIDEVRIYRDALSAGDVAILATSQSVAELMKGKPPNRRRGFPAKLKRYYLAKHASPERQTLYQQAQQAMADHRTFVAQLPTTMVMEELPEPRPAHILLRGQYDKPGERVEPALLGGLLSSPASPNDGRLNRLDFARWLINPAHPLTTRAAVNRYWQSYFGTGLVKTTEDFGAQGEQPIYPEVLDWLATEFSAPARAGAWDVKRLQRLIVTSTAYRRSSDAPQVLAQRDPENRLLARGPRVRLSAEVARDQALFAGGLLVEQLGGPSVKPRQPAGLWKELTGGEDYVSGEGADLVRRSLYTFWKRTIPPPSLTTLDAPSREFCTVRESRTNTPLQALVLLNDQDYADAALGIAARVLREEQDPTQRLALAVCIVLGRDPTPAEAKLLAAACEQHRSHYAAHGDEARQRIAASPLVPTAGLPADELAAWTAICSTLLNLDETITKE
jgi:hypothetical protein